MKPNRTRTLAGIGAALVIGAGAGAGGYSAFDGSGSHAAATGTVAQASTPIASTAGNLSVNQIWKQDGASVVDITVTSQSSQSQSGFPFPSGGTTQAEGSGWVYDANGDIVTNDHVVDGATSIKVKLQSGKTYTAKLVGTDPSTDLAVVKVDAPSSELKPIALADESSVEVGDGVVAIGSPFGLQGTVTSGIVSALGRSITSPNNYTINGAIQTDAAINHGNSGGPLLDLSGKLIGVNAQIDSDSGGNDGVGFAIPVSTVKSVVPQLINGGSVAHAYLGVSLTAGTATVASVKSGTPADSAGLQAGDTITAIDGKSVATSAALQTAIDAHKPGDKVQLTLTRNGSEKTVTVTLGTRPS